MVGKPSGSTLTKMSLECLGFAQGCTLNAPVKNPPNSHLIFHLQLNLCFHVEEKKRKREEEEEKKRLY